MLVITEQKNFEEILKSVEPCRGVYLIGCGSCTTMLHTGGKTEVLEIKKKLEDAGKKVTGWMVIPTACDSLAEDAMKASAEEIEAADCILSLACAFGAQTAAMYTDKPVYPALNTMGIGKEEGTDQLKEICLQCGECVIGQYAAICPMTQCAKGLLSGACGGSKGGKCEEAPEHDCAWILIYDRLKKFGQLDKLKEPVPPKDYSKMKRPRTVAIGVAK